MKYLSRRLAARLLQALDGFSAHPLNAFLIDVQISHGCEDVGMHQELLDCRRPASLRSCHAADVCLRSWKRALLSMPAYIGAVLNDFSLS
jgi:hypothetical protein